MLWQVVCFADIDINTLCVDPDDIEHRITPKTKAIVAVHYAGHPCDMDKICAIAKKHGVTWDQVEEAAAKLAATEKRVLDLRDANTRSEALLAELRMYSG